MGIYHALDVYGFNVYCNMHNAQYAQYAQINRTLYTLDVP